MKGGLGVGFEDLGYDSFGMMMAARTFESGSGYRYDFYG